MKKNKLPLNKAGIKAALAPLRRLLIQAVSLFAAAGTISLTRFWIYLAIVFCGAMISTLLLVKKAPLLLNHRGELKKGTKKWDLFLIIPYMVIILIVVPVIAGLELVRFARPALSYNFFLAGFLLYGLAACLINYSMLTNAHFEGTVRVQKDRAHHVVTSGPYCFVRHPGYLGMLIYSLATPLLLGSVYSFTAVAVSFILLLIRTGLEDHTLKRELPGYTDYAQKTRYRIIPGLW